MQILDEAVNYESHKTDKMTVNPKYLPIII